MSDFKKKQPTDTQYYSTCLTCLSRENLLEKILHATVVKLCHIAVLCQISKKKKTLSTLKYL